MILLKFSAQPPMPRRFRNTCLRLSRSRFSRQQSNRQFAQNPEPLRRQEQDIPLPTITLADPADEAVAIMLHSARHFSDGSNNPENSLHQRMLNVFSEKAFVLVKDEFDFRNPLPRDVLPADWNGRVRVVPSVLYEHPNGGEEILPMQSIALYQNGEEIVISEEYGYSPDFWAVSVQCQSGEYKLLEVCKTNAAADSLVDRLAAINAYTVNNEHNQISTFVRIYEEIAAGNLSNERLPSITPTDAAVAIALHSVRHCSDDSSDLGNLLYQGMLRACSEKAFGLIEYPIREVLPVDWNGRVRVVPSVYDDDVEEFVPSQGREPDFWPVFVQCWSGKY